MVRVLGLILIAVLVGCAGQSGGGGNRTLVTFSRSGGLLGVDDRLVVMEDGSMRLTRKGESPREGTVAPGTMERLRDLLTGREFRSLASSYSSRGADQMTYVIAVPGVGTVRTMDGAEHPAMLDEVIGVLSLLIE